MEDLQTLGNFVVCQLASHMSENFIGVCALRSICQLHEAGYSLAKLGIRYADYSGVADRRMGHQDTLNLDRRNIRTAANNQVLLAGNEPEIALFILSHEIAGMKPAVLRRTLY